MIDIRQPNISANTEREQLIQMRSYLYQLAQQLQWAFGSISGGGEIQTVVRNPSSAVSNSNDHVDGPKTFAALKNLIIKSADIVEAYYEEISKKLVGLYVAQSDFGIYSQETSNEIRANSDGVKQLFTNTQTIQTSVDVLNADALDKATTIQRLGTTSKDLSDTVGNLEKNAENLSGTVDKLSRDAAWLADTVNELYVARIETNAYIKTVLLYENDDGTPVYGLEIGQTNDVNGVNVFSKFARFSADRLSFYDRNDTEVAYISDYKLYITNAEITGSLFLANKFKIYYHGGLAFQWIGGGS